MSQAWAVAFSSSCLPDQLQSELYLARCGRRGGEDARRRNWGSIGSKQGTYLKPPLPFLSDKIEMVQSSLDSQKGFYPFFGVYRPFDPRGEFVTARFLSPLTFGLLRLLISVYGVAVIIIDIVLTGTLSSTVVLIVKRAMETSIVIFRISPISLTSP